MKILKSIIPACALLVISGCAHHQPPTPAPQADHQATAVAATSQVSAGGLYLVSYRSRLPDIPLNRIHAWELRLQTVDGRPVTGAAITIDGGMPAHGHGLPTSPAVTGEIEPGIYLVEGMKFNMPGRWIVTFAIRSGGNHDTVSFNLSIL